VLLQAPFTDTEGRARDSALTMFASTSLITSSSEIGRCACKGIPAGSPRSLLTESPRQHPPPVLAGFGAADPESELRGKKRHQQLLPHRTFAVACRPRSAHQPEVIPPQSPALYPTLELIMDRSLCSNAYEVDGVPEHLVQHEGPPPDRPCSRAGACCHHPAGC
jgi:hypothetical protein